MDNENWHDRYRAFKRELGLTNSSIARIIGNTPDSVKSSTQPNKEIPRWLKLAIVIHERQLKMSKDKRVIKVKSFLGQEPEGMVADFMTDEDWVKFREYQEELKKEGRFGIEVESELTLNTPIWAVQEGNIIDLDYCEKLQLMPIRRYSINMKTGKKEWIN